MMPVNHGRIVRVMNMSHKKRVGRMKIAIFVFRCAENSEREVSESA